MQFFRSRQFCRIASSFDFLSLAKAVGKFFRATWTEQSTTTPPSLYASIARWNEQDDVLDPGFGISSGISAGAGSAEASGRACRAGEQLLVTCPYTF